MDLARPGDQMSGGVIVAPLRFNMRNQMRNTNWKRNAIAFAYFGNGQKLGLQQNQNDGLPSSVGQWRNAARQRIQE